MSMSTISQLNGGEKGDNPDKDEDRDALVKIARDSATQMKAEPLTMEQLTAYRKAGSGLPEPPVER